MASEEGLKLIIDYCNEMERLGYFVDYKVKVKNTNNVHKKFWGKIGSVNIDDPRDDFLNVTLDDCTVDFSRDNVERI